MPLNNPRFLCRSRSRSPQLLNALVADYRAVDGPEDLACKTTAQTGFYTRRGLDGRPSSIRPGALTPDAPLPGRILENMDEPKGSA